MHVTVAALTAVFAMTFCHSAYAAEPLLVSTHKKKCLDVTDGQFQNGAALQLWDCSSSNTNQAWILTNGTLQIGNQKCLDVVDGKCANGGPVQLWDCDLNNAHQAWERVGSALRYKNTNFCLDVKDGQFNNGGQVQLWTCDYRSTGNQIWTLIRSAMTDESPLAKETSNAASPADTSFYGYPVIGIDAFMAKNPMCAWIKDAAVAAAKDQGLNATFLAAACIVESSCTVPANGFGPWQFSDDGAWREYGGANKDRQNVWDAAYGAARYFKALLKQTNGNLDDALRFYNGPISQGGNPQYQAEYRAWMSGQNPWERP